MITHTIADQPQLPASVAALMAPASDPPVLRRASELVERDQPGLLSPPNQPGPRFRVGEAVKIHGVRRLVCYVTKRRQADEWEYDLEAGTSRRRIGWQPESNLTPATRKRQVVG